MIVGPHVTTMGCMTLNSYINIDSKLLDHGIFNEAANLETSPIVHKYYDKH